MQEIISTLAVVAVLAAAVVLIVRSMVAKKRRGGCACGCSECANAGLCHGHGEHKK